jgi:pimeloyl-ACP methyl ester carboxylesterase
MVDCVLQLLLLLVASSLGLASATRHRDAAHTVGLHRSLLRSGHDLEALVGSAAPTEAWFAQTLDHISHQEAPVHWQQRYQYNETWHTAGGPVFLLLGGEGPASPAWLAHDTAPMVYAREHGAAVYQLEHRFYGKSQPFPDLSTERLQYLTSQQALADAAEFVKSFILKKHGEGTKVISFGGSYSGALSAWLRQAYPDVIHAAVSTSSPILALQNFEAYHVVVQASLSTAPDGPECVENIKNVTLELQELANGADIVFHFIVRARSSFAARSVLSLTACV